MDCDRRNDGSVGSPPAHDGVRSVQAALRVLELLAGHTGPVRVTDLAQRLGLSKPRVCRHLQTLEAMGLVRRVGRQGYGCGERLTRLAHGVLRERTLGDTARPLLEALRDELRQTVTLSVPSMHAAIVLTCYESPLPTSIHVKAGTVLRYPHSPAARLAVALGAVEASGQADPAVLHETLARWRSLGVDYEADTQGTGIGGVAAPVLVGTLPVALVSVVVPSRLLLPRPPAQLVNRLRRCVSAIEQGLAA